MSDPPPRRIDPLLPSVGLGLALAGAIGAHLASNAVPLGFAIGSLAFNAAIVPSLVAGTRDTLTAITIAIACTLGTAIVSFGSPTLVELAFTISLAGLVRLLVGLRLNAAIASTLVTVFAFAWLSWPIWLSHHLSAGIVSPLVMVHPIFAINGTLPPSSPDWVHLPLMYRLTALGQDVPFTMPTSVWPCVMTHVGFAVVAVTASWLLESKRSRPEDAEPSDR